MFRAHRPILRRVHTAVHTTIGSVSVLLWPYRHRTNGCVNSCVNSPEDGPVGPKHVEIRQYINKIEIVTSVGFYSIDIHLHLKLSTLIASGDFLFSISIQTSPGVHPVSCTMGDRAISLG